MKAVLIKLFFFLIHSYYVTRHKVCLWAWYCSVHQLTELITIVRTGHDSATEDTVQQKTFHEGKDQQKNVEQKTSSDASNIQVVINSTATPDVMCNALVCCAVPRRLHEHPLGITDLLFFLFYHTFCLIMVFRPGLQYTFLRFSFW